MSTTNLEKRIAALEEREQTGREPLLIMCRFVAPNGRLTQKESEPLSFMMVWDWQNDTRAREG